jgi:hypothetical protein
MMVSLYRCSRLQIGTTPWSDAVMEFGRGRGPVRLHSYMRLRRVDLYSKVCGDTHLMHLVYVAYAPRRSLDKYATNTRISHLISVKTEL